MQCLQSLFIRPVCLTFIIPLFCFVFHLDPFSIFLNGSRRSFTSVPATHTWLKLCQPQAGCNNFLSYLAKSTLVNTVLDTMSCFAAASRGWFIFYLWTSATLVLSCLYRCLIAYSLFCVCVLCFACLRAVLCTCLNFISFAFRQDLSFVKTVVSAEPF